MRSKLPTIRAGRWVECSRSISASRQRAETLLIEVWDTSEAPPRRRAASDEDENGRGLLLVQALSKEWGSDVLDTGGKIVWCECLIGEPT